jgi:O-antigen/teichoic acid export membrane protein
MWYGSELHADGSPARLHTEDDRLKSALRLARQVAARIAGPESEQPGRRRLSTLLIDSGRVFSANVFASGIALLQSVVLARALGIDDYARFVLIVGAVTTVHQLASCRMNELVVRYVSAAISAHQPGQAAAAIKLALAVEGAAALLAFVVIYGAAPWISDWLLGSSDSRWLVALYGLIVLTNVIAETTTGTLQAFEQFKTTAWLAVSARAMPFTAMLGALSFGGGLRTVLWAIVIGSGVHSALSIVLTATHTARRLGVDWWKTGIGQVDGGWRPAARFAFNTNVSSTLGTLMKDADVVWIGLLRPASEAAYYRLAVQLASAVFMPVMPLAQTLYPEMSRASAARQWTHFRSLLRRSTRLTTVYVVPIVILLSASSFWLIETLFGSDFRPAAVALVALLPGLAVSNILVWSRPALLALQQAEYTVSVNLVLAAAKLIGVITILPAWGFVGNAVLTSALYIAGFAACAWRVRAVIGNQIALGAEASRAASAVR